MSRLIRFPDVLLGIEGQDDEMLLSMLCFGEAREESLHGKIAVACVVRNRVKLDGLVPSYGKGWKGVILAPWQFSAFNAGDPNRAAMLTPLKYSAQAIWSDCFNVASDVYADIQPDVTDGATLYHTESIHPPWATHGKVVRVAHIGKHVFYRELGV